MDPMDNAPPPVEVWPENWKAYELFLRLQGQWRYLPAGGMGGPARPLGLDYLVMFAFIDRMRLDPDEDDALVADLQVLESEGLRALREQVG